MYCARDHGGGRRDDLETTRDDYPALIAVALDHRDEIEARLGIGDREDV